MKYVVFPDQDSETISFPLASCGNVDPHLVSVLHGAELACFLGYQVKNDGEKPTDIEVSVQGLTPLAQFLKEPQDARGVTALFRHLHNLIEACAYHGLPFMNVVLDIQHIYASGTPDDLRFVYLPVSGKVRGISFIREFFVDLHQHITPGDEQASDLLSRFAEIINADESLNLMLLSASLGELAQTPLVKDDAGLSVDADSIRGAKAEPSRNPSESPEGPAAEPSKEPWSSGRHVREDPGTSVLNAVNIEELMSTMADAPSTPADADSIRGTKAESAQDHPESTPEPITPPDRYRLVHTRTGNATDITGNGFSVGKSKRADFQVRNTTTVSRIHALFSCTEDACSLKDNQSLNGTFVNERRLSPNEEVSLSSGDVIRMSDEEFSFEVIPQGAGEVVA